MNRKSGFLGSGLVLICGMVLTVSTAQASPLPIIVVQDTFTASNGTTLNGRTPAPVDLPGTVYQFGVVNASWQHDIQSGAAKFGADAGEEIGLGSYGNIGGIQVSADLTFVTAAGAPNSQGTAIGFESSVDAGGGIRGLLGVAMGVSGGVPTLYVVSGGSNVTSFSLGAGFDETTPHPVSLTVDKVTGHILDMSVDTTHFSFLTTMFNGTNTSYAAMAVHGDSGSNSGTIDNFTVSVPEPASLGLLSLGAVAILRRRRAN